MGRGGQSKGVKPRSFMPISPSPHPTPNVHLDAAQNHPMAPLHQQNYDAVDKILHKLRAPLQHSHLYMINRYYQQWVSPPETRKREARWAGGGDRGGRAGGDGGQGHRDPWCGMVPMNPCSRKMYQVYTTSPHYRTHTTPLHHATAMPSHAKPQQTKHRTTPHNT